MGSRITYYYYTHHSHTAPRELIIQHYTYIRNWLLQYPEECGEVLYAYIKRTPDLAASFENTDSKMINELAFEFKRLACLIDEEKFMTQSFGSFCSTYRYEASYELVASTGDNYFSTLWHYIISGRSLCSDGEFISYTNAWKIGYLSTAERKALMECIISHFGTLDHIREQYGNEEIQTNLAYETADDNTIFPIPQPPSEGILLLLEALIDVEDYDGYIFTTIE